MDGFIELISRVVGENGLTSGDVYLTGNLTILPGYFRATKSWDLLIIHRNTLVAAFELKSQVGPSFGNNFNNRCEEALGSAGDLLTAFREGALGSSVPFMGYLMVLEDSPTVHTPVKVDEPHYPVFPEFKGASYAQRYALLCDRLVKEHLYTSAALLLTSQADGLRTGEYREPDASIGWRRMMVSLAGHVATVAALDQAQGNSADITS
jgi:type II restriction enzyme